MIKHLGKINGNDLSYIAMRGAALNPIFEDQFDICVVRGAAGKKALNSDCCAVTKEYCV
jgi:hypothetical protein